MSDFEFKKGENAVIKVNSKILGAVTQAVCTSENSFCDINEFLTDKPVFRVPESKYKIELCMAVGDDNPFVCERFFDTVELVLDNRTVKYCGCCVEKMRSAVNAKGNAEMTVWISAETRVVE